MLQELRGAGLGWDNPFVQCRMQTALRALQDQQQQLYVMSAAAAANSVAMAGIDECADLIDNEPTAEQQPPAASSSSSRMAFVRFVPPASEEGFADEVYSPPLVQQPQQPFALPLMQKRQHLQSLPLPPPRPIALDVVQDMRNRIALRRMLAEYEAGELAAPVYHQRNYAQQLRAADVDDNDGDNNARQAMFVDEGLPLGAAYGVKRAQMQPLLFEDEPRIVPDPFEEQQSAFREVAAREYHMPKVVLDSAALARAAERSNELPLAGMVLSVTGDEQPELETMEQLQQPHHLHQGNRYANRVLEHLEQADRQEYNAAAAANGRRPASGVYTEGGLVYLPDSAAGAQRLKQQYVKQMEAASLLNSMLGFTRHERLDVKKPGPLVQPVDAQQQPPLSSSTEKAADAVGEGDAEAEERPSGTGFKDLFTPKMKKILHQLNDHGPHSVDEEFTYVIMRAP